MRKLFLLLLLGMNMSAQAVFINNQGLGEVLIVPYYTVNNQLNTLVSINNTQAQPKAIKINIRESLNGYTALSYNVYLDAHDSWTFALVSSADAVSGFEGDENAMMLTGDQSCAPGIGGNTLLSTAALVDGPQTLTRLREGFIEVLEMGVLQGEMAAAVQMTASGAPADCQKITQAWQTGGLWHQPSGGDSAQQLNHPSGGLLVEADILNVTEGINYSTEAVALADFYADGQVAHVAPEDGSLSLDAAAPRAQVYAVQTNNNLGQLRDLEFERGIDAVSSLLMSQRFYGDFYLDSVVGASTETVSSLPTFRFYDDGVRTDSLGCADYLYSRQPLLFRRFNSEGGEEIFNNICYFCENPVPVVNNVCGAVTVQVWVLPDPQFPHSILTTPNQYITGSENAYLLVSGGRVEVEHGSYEVLYMGDFALTGTDSAGRSRKIQGLPMIGMNLHQYVNGNAADGLLAQYGSVNVIKHQPKQVQLIEAGE